MFRLAQVALVSLAAFAFGAACESEVAMPVGATSTAASGAGAFAASACHDCVVAACAGEHGDCLSEPSCADYWSCVEACPVGADGNADATCEIGCSPAEGSAAEAAALALLGCRTQGAGTSCDACGYGDQLPALLSQECGEPDLSSCGACAFAACCDSAAACQAEPQCQSVLECTGNCGSDVECTSNCYAAYPAGSAVALPFATCAAYHCAGPCGVQNDCSTCSYENCANTLVACDTDPACYQLGLCVAACGLDEQACQACRDEADPTVVANYDALNLCWKAACPGICP